MPLLKVSLSNKITATVSLESTTADKLDLYAAFTKTTADAVLDAALAHVFDKDKDFQKYCEAHSGSTPRSLRVKVSGTPAKPKTARGSAADDTSATQ